MYSINETYENHILNSITRMPKSKIVVGDTEYTGVTHLKTFPKIEHTTGDMFGSFPAKTCEFEIYNIDGSVELRGKEVSVFRGLDIEGTVPWIPMGIFKAESKDITSNLTTKTIKFKGSDRSHLFDVAFNSALHSYPCTILQFVKQLCKNHSIILENEDFPFYDFVLEKAPEFAEGVTERELIRKIAQLGGCVAQITREGKLKISQPEVATVPITSGKYSSLSRENTVYVTGLTLSQSENEDLTVNDDTYVGAYGEFVYKITDNPFIKDRCSEVIDGIASCYLGRSITPFVLTGFIDDFIYDLNDLITVRDKSGVEFTTPLLSLTTQSRIKSDFKTEVQKEESSSDGELEGSVKQELKEANKKMGAYKNAQSALNDLMSNALGLHISEADDGAGGKIYYYHDTADIANATYIATLNSNGFAFTSGSGCWNGGKPNWTNGMTKEGNAILKMLSVHKLSADLIEAGILSSLDGSIQFSLNEGKITTKSEGTAEIDQDSNEGTARKVSSISAKEISFGKEFTVTDSEGNETTEYKGVSIGKNGIEINCGTADKYSFSKPDDWDNMSAFQKAAYKLGQMLLGAFHGITFKIGEQVTKIMATGIKSDAPYKIEAPEIILAGSLTPQVIPSGTDFDTVTDNGNYVGEVSAGNGTTSNYVNCPIVETCTFKLKVSSLGIAGQKMQTMTTCHKTASKVLERFLYGDSWGEWMCVSDYDNNLLWMGALFMHEGQTVNLPEPLSKQPHGIVLRWSYYTDATVGDNDDGINNPTAQNYNFIYKFIPKEHAKSHPGGGVFVSNAYAGIHKYVYINDNSIGGNSQNDIEAGTANGIAYNNRKWVLRAVIGV